MNRVLAVYDKELVSYFRSPIAYFVVAVFLLGTGYFFIYEVFLTGTAAEVVPVVNVDSRQIGDGKPGPITQKLIEGFHEFVRQYSADE